jgi:multidrug efflux pump subunit AcrB
LREVQSIDGIVDTRLHQVTNTPQVKIDVDRNAAQRLGLSQRDVANDVLVALASSGQTAPSFWLDPKKGVQYSVAVQSPQHRLDSLRALEAIPIGAGLGGEPNFLGNVAEFSRQQGATNITHFNAMPTYDVLANVSGRDLGSVADSLRALLARYQDKLPRGTTITLKGQIESMEDSFTGLAYGLLFAIVLVYLLMVVNYQSLLDPFVILTALPAALAGIGWMLYATDTTLSVPALMGAIMCVGVATANSILVVTFANDLRRQHAAGTLDARAAALEAGTTRLRPVIMTAFAMIVGMLPMSLGLGEGGEQNAPLGRAVIGGLLLATVSTLFFVPLVYSVLRRKAPKQWVVEESP